MTTTIKKTKPFAGWRNTVKNAWRHLVPAAMVLLALPAVLAAGHPPLAPASPRPPPIIITAWTHSDPLSPEYALIKKSADAFNQRQHAYRVEFVSSLRRDYANWVHREAANGTLPCLLDFDGPFLAEFAWPQYFQPIDPFVPQAMLDDFLPSIVAQGSYQGRLYSLGQFESGLVLWGNLRYLRAAGVRIPTLEAPWSLAEFEQVLASLATLEGLAYPINFAFYNSRADEFFSYGYAPIMQSFGGDLINRRTLRQSKGVLDGPRSVDAIGHLKRWVAAGWTSAFDHPTDLATGKVALSWNGHWNYRALLKALGPDLVVLPLPDFGHGIKTGMGSWSWAISSSCHTPAGAWAFLADLLSTEAILDMTNMNGAVPARRSALRRSPLYAPNGPLRLIVLQLELGGIARPATPAYGTISTAFRHAIENIIRGADTQTELSKAADAIDRHIAAHHGYPYP